MPASSQAPPRATTAKAKAKGTSQGKGSDHTSQGTGSASGYTPATHAVTSCTNRGAKGMKTRGTPWMVTGPICREYTEHKKEPPLESLDTVRGAGDSKGDTGDWLGSLMGISMYDQHHEMHDLWPGAEDDSEYERLRTLCVDEVEGDFAGLGTEHKDDKEPPLERLDTARGEVLGTERTVTDPPLEEAREEAHPQTQTVRRHFLRPST
jgi:hypothetical protein